MSKLSFRARALDAGKPMPIYMAEELPDLPDFSAINRAVPQMPSGMQKEEECEHHLQRAIVAGLIIPTPEVSDIPNREFYEKVYPANFKQPRQLIHMQPFAMEQDIPDYDMDSEDERWLQSQAGKLDLSADKFEEMMDRLEKGSSQSAVTLNDAKALLKDDDDLIIAVFDYWLNKRLKMQHPLILTVKTEQRHGTAANNPYLAFRRRTEKMQTRKNRKNDETSYEKMLKLRRDLCRAVTLLEMVKRREKLKREHVHLTVEVFEKRYQAQDFSGAIVAEVSAVKAQTRPAFTPIFQNHYNQSWNNKSMIKDEPSKREKRQYKKRSKHKSNNNRGGSIGDGAGMLSSDDESNLAQLSPEHDEAEDEGRFAFRRNKSCSYHMPLPYEGNWPWCSKAEHGTADKRFRFTLTSISNPKRCIGLARRRLGRGGRVIIDRLSSNYDDLWRHMNYSITETPCGLGNNNNNVQDGDINDVKSEGVRTNGSDAVKKKNVVEELREMWMAELSKVNNFGKDEDDMVECVRSVQKRDWLHFRPKTPPPDHTPPCDMLWSQDSFYLDPVSCEPPPPFSVEIHPLEEENDCEVVEEEEQEEDEEERDSRRSNGLGGAKRRPGMYVTDPFVFDTRQMSQTSHNNNTSHQQHQHSNTLINCNVNNNSDNSDNNNSDSDRVGCSSFVVTCIGGNNNNNIVNNNNYNNVSNSNRRRGGFKVNSLLNLCDERKGGVAVINRTSNDGGNVGNANGILAQLGFEVPSNKSKNNKLSYAYTGNMSTYPKTTASLSLRTTLNNSHSANSILDIAMADDDDVTNDDKTTPDVATPNKTKSPIVRQKNNIIMEVT